MDLRQLSDSDGSDFPIAEAPSDSQRALVADWLDAGLRRGQTGRLAAEYPLSMGDTRGHRCIFDGSAPVAHAMMHPGELIARGHDLRVGMIGNVYTEPRHRGHGLASACVSACVHDAKSADAALVLLWSDAPDFYRPLGFHPAGRETIVRLDADVLDEVRSHVPTPICVGPAFPNEWEELETLYAAKPERLNRAPGNLRRLAAAPDTVLRVARRGGEAVGYAAAGRGDDFRGVAHEWAGSEGGVLACLVDLFEAGAATAVLAGPDPGSPIQRLVAAGAGHEVGHFALARLVDASAVWRSVGGDESGVSFSQSGEQVLIGWGAARYGLDMQGALDLFFGAGVEVPAAQSWPEPLREQLAAIVPYPLYVWGFDSI